MKRFLGFSALVLSVLVLLCSCDLFVTDEYRAYNGFYKRYKDGMDKEKVLGKLVDCPDCFYDAGGNLFHPKDFEDDEYKEVVMENDCRIWVYSCYELPDPANPYRLKITFDENGKSIGVEFEIVPGG